MFRSWLTGPRKYLAWSCAALLAAAGVSRADDKDTAELRALLEQQQKQIQELKRQLDSQSAPPARTTAGATADPAKPPMVIEEDSIKKIVASYLQENPGAGLPPSVQTGYELGRGFVIRSAPDPKYVKWDDDCKVPFEMRIHGRVQLNYYDYRVTDPRNHVTNREPAVGT
jgi:hypothetical protein